MIPEVEMAVLARLSMSSYTGHVNRFCTPSSDLCYVGALKARAGFRVSGFFGRPSGWVGRGFRVFCADINKGPCGPTAALRAPKSHQTRAGWSCTGLLNNAMSVSHILGVMSCKWPNFTAATAFEIQPRAIFFARGAEVGGWVAGFGFPQGPSGWVGRGFRVLITVGGVGWEKKRNPGRGLFFWRA